MKIIEEKKKLFLERYNFSQSKEEAANKAINASVQHNLLYSPRVNLTDKKNIKEYWRNSLREIGEEFKTTIEVPNYEVMINLLQKEMNKKFQPLFDNGSAHGSMFRISHSQKSISVYIKHLWCMNEIIQPNICPIDRIVLGMTKAKLTNDIGWGYVNSIEEHQRKFLYVQNEAKFEKMNVAVWELLKFKTQINASK